MCFIGFIEIVMYRFWECFLVIRVWEWRGKYLEKFIDCDMLRVFMYRGRRGGRVFMDRLS